MLNPVSRRVEKGVCWANSTEELKSIIKKQGNVLVSYKKTHYLVTKSFFTIEKFTIPFFRSMYTLISHSIDITQALNITLCSFEKLEHQAIIRYLIYRISSGDFIHEAMKNVNNTDIFDKVCIKIIEIAEKTATLSKSIEYILQYLENNIATRKLIKNSMWYPILLLSVILSVTLFWIFGIMPTFVNSLNDIGIHPPFISVCLLHFRNFCVNNMILTTLFLGAIILISIMKGRYIISKLPIISKISRDLKMLKFIRSMYIMLREKVEFIEALESSAGSINDDSFPQTIDSIVNMIKKGTSIYNAFKESQIFTYQEMAILSAGESTETLTEAFKIIADILHINTQNKINKIISMLQPIITILMGGLLLIVVYSVFLPMYNQLEAYM